MADSKPVKPTPKMADVAKPDGTQATSRPVIVGHGAVIRDPMMAPADWSEPVMPKAPAAEPVLPDESSDVSVTPPADSVPDQADPTASAVPAEPTTAPAVAPDAADEPAAVSESEAEPVAAPEPAAKPAVAGAAAPAAAPSRRMVADPNAKDPSTGEPKPASPKPSITLVGKKIQPLNGFEGDGKDQAKAADAAPPDGTDDPAKADAVQPETVGALSVERLQELKNGKEYKIAISKVHSAQTSWAVILLIMLLLAIGAAAVLDAGWVDVGLQMPFDIIK